MDESIIANINTGRITDIIKALKKHYKTNNLATISLSDRLDALCSVLNFSYDDFDSLIADHSEVLRPIKGLCFEVAFQRLLTSNGIECQDIGGDGDVDLQANGHDLQLKTPNMAGTKGNFCEYKTHKTHGAKSEKESKSYYHKVEDFADFFVGLISYSPFKVFIIPKEELPRYENDEHFIKSPFKINWKTGKYKKYVNAFHLLGFSLQKIDVTSISSSDKEFLPKTSYKIGLTTDIILTSILREENFRVWDMSIRGFAREIIIKKILTSKGVLFSDEPLKFRPSRGEKADLAVFTKTGTKFIQIKGVSTNNCDFKGKDSTIATETQLTRGRVNDHPTQSRLYMVTDFEYLILAVDPAISYMVYNKPQWQFFLIPSSQLEIHRKYNRRYKSLQKFKASELVQYDLLESIYLLR